MSTEASIVNSICQNLKRRGIWYKKNHGDIYSKKGEPDLEVMIPVGPPPLVKKYYFEVKKLCGRTTPLQLHRIEQLRKAGAIAEVVHTWTEVETIIGVES